MAVARCQGGYVYSDGMVRVVSGLNGGIGNSWILSDGGYAKTQVISLLVAGIVCGLPSKQEGLRLSICQEIKDPSRCSTKEDNKT
jgi:hypothetical protein